MIVRWVVAVLLLSCIVHAQVVQYAGPNSLGPFRLDRKIPLSKIFEEVGKPATSATGVTCFRSKSNVAFLQLSPQGDAYDSYRIAGFALISSFPNCIDRTVQVTEADIQNWKTEKGIGLGSSEADVLKVYGRPSAVHRITGNAYRSVIVGDYDTKTGRYSNQVRPELGDKVFAYAPGKNNDPRGAVFGIRGGLVVWIEMSKSE
jgi:hypothetical protein